MGSFAVPIEVDLGGLKGEVELHMSQYSDAEAVGGKVPAFLVLMKVTVPGPVNVDPEEVLELLSPYVNTFTTSISGAKPLKETKRTTVTAAGEGAKARLYEGQVDDTPVLGPIAVWQKGSNLQGALAIAPDKEYSEALALLAGAKLPKISATPGFEFIFALATLAGAGLLYRRRP